MNKNEIFFGLLSVCVTICSLSSASPTKVKRNEDEIVSSTTKINQHCKSHQNASNKYQDDMLAKENKNIEQNYIDNIPEDILLRIFYQTEPLSIIHSSMTSHYNKLRFGNTFWENYLIIHKQRKWNQSAPLAKVAFAHSLFERGEIEKAAILGLPKAIARSKENKKYLESNKNNKIKHAIKNCFKYISIPNSDSLTYVVPMGCLFPFTPLQYNFENRVQHPKNWTSK